MSGIGSWGMSVFKRPSSNSEHSVTSKRNASVQTLLSASSSTNISREWLCQKVNENICDIYYSGEEPDAEDEMCKEQPKIRRKRIPDKPSHHVGLWSVLKDLIGQNLTTIALPVNLNEPLTVLQRMTESFESSYLLDRAAECENIYDQIAYVAAFAISGYASSAERNGKPFNPLLGETYECDRSDELGWKCIAEQVSHHPSISALHCESDKWVFWEDLTGDLYFRGKYIRILPVDYRYVKFKTNEKTYRLERPETIIHNIIFGKIWVDHKGKVEIVCLDEAAKCDLTFTPYSSFSRRYPRVFGDIRDLSKVKRMIRGSWNEKIEIAFNLEDDDGEMNAKTASYQTVWERKPPTPESSKYYNFSEFACTLNEYEAAVAPTDSRRRPDVRMMENGEWDLANEHKLRLEEKQRSKRYLREAENLSLSEGDGPIDDYCPIWFTKKKMLVTEAENEIFFYKGGYWEAKNEGDWSMCPDIF
ncbi:Oxysterol-binding protein 1 [Pseudolycoriella hygida]|uniref:Oxysterol-binding protein 1 n=1 Tax=Pseudolycoriella hygida TaxID=35572 RepID=A0A9Q0S1K6_9DIPT|nr:Oxysterol-binding protein 1 [Pseudolycoriella hygida]